MAGLPQTQAWNDVDGSSTPRPLQTRSWVPGPTGTWATNIWTSLSSLLGGASVHMFQSSGAHAPGASVFGTPVAGASEFTLSSAAANATTSTSGGAGITTVTPKASTGMIINLIWDASVALAPAGFKAAIQNAANLLAQAFSDAITLNFNVGWGNIGGQAITQSGVALGGPSTGDFVATGTLKANLAAHATGAADQAVVASVGTQNPNGNGAIAVWRAQEKALGLISANDTGIDGYIGFATNFSSSAWTAGALHELTHAMGRTSGYASYGILDLLRYSSPGVHAYAGGGAQYFSLDGGATHLANFSPTSDYGDFATDALTLNDSFNAYVGSNSNALTQLDLIELDAIGFTRAGSATPPLPVLADLTISAASLAKSAVNVGSSLQLSYGLADTGGSAGASVAQVLIDGKLVATNAFAGLVKGASSRVTDTLSTAGLAVGHHTLTVVADANHAVNESNETNNTSTLGFDILALPPDLAISSVRTGAASVKPGTVLGVIYSLADIGAGGAGASTSGIYIDGKLTPAVQALAQAIGAGGTANYAANISTAGLSIGIHTLTVKADILNAVAESNEANNALSTTFRVA